MEGGYIHNSISIRCLPLTSRKQIPNGTVSSRLARRLVGRARKKRPKPLMLRPFSYGVLGARDFFDEEATGNMRLIDST
jgi:hypothetical protein